MSIAVTILGNSSAKPTASGHPSAQVVNINEQLFLVDAGESPASTNPVANTTITCVVTNARLTKAQATKVASMAHDGYARSIRPVHTSMDGDSIYAVSAGSEPVDQDLVGTLAAEVMSEAIIRAAESAEGAYGFPAMRDLDWIQK
jgi:L-aminopeptidase/D-esterase-like protein